MPTVELVERRQHDAPRRCCMSKDVSVGATSVAPAVEPFERRVADVDTPRPSGASQDVSVSSDVRGTGSGARRAPRRRCRRAATKQRVPGRQRL
jgi:hypothetical protein